MPNVVYHADISEMRGKQVDQVYTRARSGPTRRSRVMPTNPRTPAQAQVRANMAQAANAYKNLSATDVALWEAYAATQRAVNPLSGFSYVPSGNTVFTGLGAKFLQITPGGTVPLTPPTASFVGDTATVSVFGGAGVIEFHASHANASGVKTEMLLQRLPSPNRKPDGDKYRSQGFVAFAGPSPGTSLPMPPGVYAAAYRFVLPATGQVSPLTPVGVVTVS